MRTRTDEDWEKFKECLAADPDHHEQDPLEWIAPNGEFIVFVDEKGTRLFVRLERTLRVHVQHEPGKRPRMLFYKAFSWLQSAARKSGFSEVVFESTASPLVKFFGKAFGFAPVVNNHSVRII